MRRLISLIICAVLLAASAGAASETPISSGAGADGATPDPDVSLFEQVSYARLRKDLVNSIEAQGVTNSDVLRAMRAVPRHEYVLQEFVEYAYVDSALPIGYGQTISAPYVVAWMTELLDLSPGERVLEIGTGSGYQASVLAELGYVEVYSIEIVPELAQSVEDRLAALGYDEIHLMQGDGYYGWLEFAPFDAIIVTAAPDHLPAPLAEQLAESGRLVIPIGPPGGYQSLWKFIKEAGVLTAYNMGGVVFVPFTGAGIQGDVQTPSP